MSIAIELIDPLACLLDHARVEARSDEPVEREAPALRGPVVRGRSGAPSLGLDGPTHRLRRGLAPSRERSCQRVMPPALATQPANRLPQLDDELTRHRRPG